MKSGYFKRKIKNNYYFYKVAADCQWNRERGKKKDSGTPERTGVSFHKREGSELLLLFFFVELLVVEFLVIELFIVEHVVVKFVAFKLVFVVEVAEDVLFFGIVVIEPVLILIFPEEGRRWR
ncbi:MAG: hypothetical protein L6W00_23830 [Lentisphaeria bacterium]|nr:MAG: hypothetical protein L6W00_23830 [Lentisphaeria bacterium]